MDNEIELIKVRAERDEAIKAWKVSCDDVKRLMAENARAVAIEAMLTKLVRSTAAPLPLDDFVLAKKALEPVEPMTHELCLVGIGGDCGPLGINDKPDVLPFDRKHESIVREFLRAQLAWQLTVHFDGSTNSEHYRALRRAVCALREAGIFEHKWHGRTQWDLAFTEEVTDAVFTERAIGS